MGGVSSSKKYFISGNQLRWTKLLSQNFDWMCLGDLWACGGLVALQSLLTIKKGARTLNFQSNEPLLKFLRRPLSYEVPYSKGKKIINSTLCQYRSYMPSGHTLKPLPRGLWGSVFLKNVFSIWKSTMLNKMAIWKFWLDVFGEMMGVGGRGLVALQSLSTIKKGTNPLISSRMSLFWSFYDNTFYKKP